MKIRTRIFKFNQIRTVILFFLSTFFIIGCKKFIEVEAPITSINGKNVYTDDINAISAVTGIYSSMSSSGFSLNLSLLPELSADNLDLFSLSNLNYTLYYQNALIPDYNVSTIQFWGTLYAYINKTNTAIAGLNSSITLNPSVKKRLLGEVYFLRAFYYFYLVNLYGDVPLSLTPDYVVNDRLLRINTADVYKQMIADLLIAKQQLDDKYVDATLINSTSERVRPNGMAVNALLARIYLYVKNYTQADELASEVINQTNLYSSKIPLDQVFLKNSLETIWALQPVKSNINTDEGNFFTLDAGGPDNIRPVYLAESLIDVFEDTDQRKTKWVSVINSTSPKYPFAAKYKLRFGNANVDEYPIVLRLSEQYLIRAEARSELNNISGSQSDLNVIRNRAGLPDTKAASIGDLRTAILKERRVELFLEWGNRWFDLKRTGNLNAVMKIVAPSKGTEWESYYFLYPIPATDIQYNNNLNQNNGYN